LRTGRTGSKPRAISDSANLGQPEMRRYVINRHDGTVNVCFVDFSVRKVGLKELWTLKWHRQFATNGPWTRLGGAKAGDWPPWMRGFKDYK
jgi:prepilin-type processing-associated H-X9-DG protein